MYNASSLGSETIARVDLCDGKNFISKQIEKRVEVLSYGIMHTFHLYKFV